MKDRSERAGSPFWKGRSVSQNQGMPNSHEQSPVVGASYSHADILKGIAQQHAPPRTPPRSSSHHPQPVSSPSSHRPAIWVASPRTSYTDIMDQGMDSWDRPKTRDDADVDDEEEEEDIVYDDDEDEFGLPTIASMRRKQAQSVATKQPKTVGPGGGGLGKLDTTSLGVNSGSNRQRADSSDIAEERGLPMYPTARKGEGKILRPQYKDILRDPANALHLINHGPPPKNAPPKEMDQYSSRISRINKFKRLLQTSTVPLAELRNLAWSGVPDEVRAMTWQLLLGYLPANSERRISTLERKRKEYLDGVRQAFERNSAPNAPTPPAPSTGRGRGLDEAIWHQISIDVPRTSPHIQLYGYEATQRSLERILYVWAIRHPASGYVQGINDLVTPFWQVFLGVYVTDLNVEADMDPGQLPRSVLDAVEADSFWCLTKLLDGIQDNYIYAQPGIHRQVGALRDLTMRIDSTLAKHLENEGVEFMQFSFRWMNCLLMREMSVQNTIRMWDTYMAEEQGFSRFHLYVCAAFLVKWSEQLVKMDFQEIMMFLQALPTKDWTEKDIELLLSEAFIWQSLFQDSRAHLRPAGDRSPENGFQ
ncbi:Ypt/Rab-specific GTPase-activating protein [Aspergillus campestris IBT 28561]|uniref:Ypt/Rab-specific GTPase-activating protein n=1 Tax=Aspergillus campestris (strain IBT 28561) TaxID=1392248 RepID=A0A2I1CZ59_ASPC2|nr:Ypt/Rab-specific GTPase-activating protein [Aspergillus campestris IBT 28561]PKY02919.1 Ypt/Rab-specific GTPase-activating protein [Aspergillus campestris IBT 28561]